MCTNNTTVKVITAAKAKILSAIAAGAQSGAVTHHHDQVIVPINLRVKNIRNISPNNGKWYTVLVAG